MALRITFTEIGCPAIDKGANEPNVFPDPKVGGSRLPHFSNGSRDALMQERALAAVLGYWDPASPDFSSSANPVSTVYGGRMVDAGRTHLWAWDARPFPAFPYRDDVWSDGGNWQTGHWLNGRLGTPTTASLIAAILRDYDIADFEIGDLDGTVDGYVIGSVGSARDALQPLADSLGFASAESGALVRFVRRGSPRLTLSDADFAVDDDKPLLTIRRAQETELPAEFGLSFLDSLNDYRSRTVASRRLETASRRQTSLSTTLVADDGVATALADDRLQDIWNGRETYSFALDSRRLDIEPADVLTLVRDDASVPLIVSRIEDGLIRRLEARTLDPAYSVTPKSPGSGPTPGAAGDPGPPEVLVLDLPSLSGTDGLAARLALFADPWTGPFGVAIGTADAGYRLRQSVAQRATIGTIPAPAPSGPTGRFDEATRIDIDLSAGSLASLPDAAVLNGGNIAAIGNETDGFELIQYRTAELIGADRWRISGLLRGQGGTTDLAAVGHASGARFIRLNAATPVLDLDAAEKGLTLGLRAGPLAKTYDPDRFAERAFRITGRALVSLAPVHLTGKRNAAGDVALSWIRQTRIGGDSWESVEVPLGEAPERYSIELWESTSLRATYGAASPSLDLTAAELAAVLTAPGAAFTARVRQVSLTAGPGIATEIFVDV